MTHSRPLLWQRFGPQPKRSFPGGLYSVLIFASIITVVRAADTPAKFDRTAAQKWASIVEWVGFWEASETRTVKYRNSLNAKLWSDSLKDAQTSSQFRLRRATDGSSWSPDRGSFEWEGKGVERWVSTESSAASESNAHDTRTTGAGRTRSSAIWFRLNLADGLATFGPGANEKWPEGRMTGWLNTAGINWQNVDRPNPLLRTIPVLYKGEKHQGWWEFNGAPGVITINDGKTENTQQDDTTYGTEYQGHVVLCPVYDDLECEVTIDGYADWLPAGSIEDPKKPGDALVAHAVLISKKGKNEDIPEVERFRFELVDTSREPGVCMNWPLGAKDQDYDFKLADFVAGGGGLDPSAIKKFLLEWGMSSMGNYEASMMPANVPMFSFPHVSDDGQKGELVSPPKDKEGRPFADAAIECYDFGAKSELRVICVLKDGREIIGLMKGEGGEQDLVRLPKRAAADWIAAKWRADSKAGDLPAGDDDEKVQGQKYNGDGFTLYEEYRGWIENGKHITGDPRRKDFMVLNLIGADADAGIELFAEVSQLKVRSEFTEAEFDWRVRKMNANHATAPHRVTQHTVFIVSIPWRQGDVTAGKTTLSDKTRSGRPATAVSIGILNRGDPKSVFTDLANQLANLAKPSVSAVYNRAVAHELLHSVGVEHHGEYGDDLNYFSFQGAHDPTNPTGRARFVDSRPPSDFDYARLETRSHPTTWSDFDRGPTIQLRWEDTREDLAELVSPVFEQEVERLRHSPNWDPSSHATRRAMDFARYGKDANFWAELELYSLAASRFEQRVYAADVHRLQSGNERCLMRYYFANAYKVTGTEHAYYMIRPGKNVIGFDLCRSPVGTGANDKDHEPQSRFGDCFPGRGNCFEQICPNDAIPAPKS